MSTEPKPPAAGAALSSAHAKTIAAAHDPAAPPWMKQVALLTGVLAALGGFLAVRATNLSNEAIYLSNQGVLRQAQASDAWAEYQADSIKARILETQLAVLPADAPAHAQLADKEKEYRDGQNALKGKAEEKLKERDDQLANGRKNLDQKDTLGYAGMAVQLAIALASVAALTKRKEAYIIALFIGFAGAAVTAYAILGPHLSKG